MTITPIDLGTGSNATPATSIVITVPAAPSAPSSLLLLAIAYDNSKQGGLDPFPGGPGATDSRGNTWVPRVGGHYDPGSTNAGVSMQLLGCDQSVAPVQAGDTVTVSFNGHSTASKAWTMIELATDLGATHSVQMVWGDNRTGRTASPTISTVLNLLPGDAMVAFGGAEGGDFWSGDADVYNGAWSSHQHAAAGTGNSGIAVTSQHKIITANGTQTYNPTFSFGAVDCAIAYATFREFPRP